MESPMPFQLRARKIIAGDLAIPEQLWQGSE
jgi:hypothetical protein